MKKRILILTASFGEGHNSAARGVRDGLARVAPEGTEVELRDLFAEAYGPINELVRRSYLALVNFGPPQSAAYAAASADLERTFNERLKLLAPATRTRVQADLETIRRANADLRSALAHDPASPLLLQLLHSTWQQEIDLYTSVAQSTEPLLRRT